MSLHAWISVFSDFFPVFAALYFYRRLDQVLKIAATFFFVSAMSDGLQTAFFYTKVFFTGVTTSNPVIHIYLIISILLLGAIYFKVFFNPILKKLVVALSVITFLIMLAGIFFIEGIMEYPATSNTILSVVAILFSLTYFYQLLSRQDFVHIEKQPLFWISAGVLFYYSLTIFLFMLYKKLTLQQMGLYFMINSITNIFANILFTIGLLCKPQKTTT